MAPFYADGTPPLFVIPDGCFGVPPLLLLAFFVFILVRRASAARRARKAAKAAPPRLPDVGPRWADRRRKPPDSVQPSQDELPEALPDEPDG